MSGASAAALAITVLLIGSVLAIPSLSTTRFAPGPVRVGSSDSISISAIADYRYNPSTLEGVPTATNITVTFLDQDTLPHSFTIPSYVNQSIDPSLSSTGLAAFLVAHPPFFSITVNGSGDQVTSSFLSPANPGWYEFVCNVAGHFQDGMYGYIAFGENLPPNLTTPNRVGVGGLSLTPGEAVAIGVIVVALVGYVIWWRRRSPDRSIPEEELYRRKPPASGPGSSSKGEPPVVEKGR